MHLINCIASTGWGIASYKRANWSVAAFRIYQYLKTKENLAPFAQLPVDWQVPWKRHGVLKLEISKEAPHSCFRRSTLLPRLGPATQPYWLDRPIGAKEMERAAFANRQNCTPCRAWISWLSEEMQSRSRDLKLGSLLQHIGGAGALQHGQKQADCFG